MTTASCFAAHASDSPLVPHQVTRRVPGTNDVHIDIEFCGVCHTDIHYAWGRTTYPIVPGHEIVGKVRALGSSVTDLHIGQRVAVGCFVNSCHHCSSCDNDMEQYCLSGFTPTYNGPSADEGGVTYGGYSKNIVVDRHFVLKVPENLDPAGAAPLLCAGITPTHH